MNNLVIVLGNSRSGKDALADYLVENHGYKVEHPLMGFYGYLESHFGLPKGSIREGSGKKFVISPNGDTISDFLIAFYHTCNDKGIVWTKPYMDNLVENINQNTVITGVRKVHEWEAIKKGFYSGNYNLIPVLVSRPGADGYSTDDMLSKIWLEVNKLAVDCYSINNDSTLVDYYAKIRRIDYL